MQQKLIIATLCFGWYHHQYSVYAGNTALSTFFSGTGVDTELSKYVMLYYNVEDGKTIAACYGSLEDSPLHSIEESSRQMHKESLTKLESVRFSIMRDDLALHVAVPEETNEFTLPSPLYHWNARTQEASSEPSSIEAYLSTIRSSSKRDVTWKVGVYPDKRRAIVIEEDTSSVYEIEIDQDFWTSEKSYKKSLKDPPVIKKTKRNVQQLDEIPTTFEAGCIPMIFKGINMMGVYDPEDYGMFVTSLNDDDDDSTMEWEEIPKVPGLLGVSYWDYYYHEGLEAIVAIAFHERSRRQRGGGDDIKVSYYTLSYPFLENTWEKWYSMNSGMYVPIKAVLKTAVLGEGPVEFSTLDYLNLG